MVRAEASDGNETRRCRTFPPSARPETQSDKDGGCDVKDAQLSSSTLRWGSGRRSESSAAAPFSIRAQRPRQNKHPSVRT